MGFFETSLRLGLGIFAFDIVLVYYENNHVYTEPKPIDTFLDIGITLKYHLSEIVL